MADNLLELRSISKNFGAIQAIRELSLEVPRGSLIVLLGPARRRQGRPTLRIVAGLESPTAGEVWVEGQNFTRLQPNQRDIAMIFDNLALYPNKTGWQNIASPLKLAGMSKADIANRVDEIASLLKIGHILDRVPATFSGGERQRVALGRAMVREPRFFLLDEPLSSLDFMLRIELRTELKRLQRDLGRTFLFATPDYTEALALADTVCVLLEGEVRQIAKAQDLYDEPADRDVARFVGNPRSTSCREGFLARTARRRSPSARCNLSCRAAWSTVCRRAPRKSRLVCGPNMYESCRPHRANLIAPVP